MHRSFEMNPFLSLYYYWERKLYGHDIAVMPTMLERVGERIPIPDYMKEQMPTLMPRVMASLMPHMIKDVVPLVTQPMINHLRGKK